jgi:hypothetical protein
MTGCWSTCLRRSATRLVSNDHKSRTPGRGAVWLARLNGVQQHRSLRLPP